MVGVQFTGLDGKDVDIQKLFTGMTGVLYDDFGMWRDTAPRIDVYKEDGSYEFYYYLKDAAVDATTFKEGWANSLGDYVTRSLKPGEAVWFKAAEKCTITTSGQIFTAGTVSKTCVAGLYTMLANAKPIALKLNNKAQVTYSGLTGVLYDDVGMWRDTAPRIDVYKEDGSYEFYYYLKDAAVDASTFKEGWANSLGDYVDATIPVGAGFWVKATTGEFTINFVQ